MVNDVAHYASRRITLPESIRRELEIKEGEILLLFTEENKKYGKIAILQKMTSEGLERLKNKGDEK